MSLISAVDVSPLVACTEMDAAPGVVAVAPWAAPSIRANVRALSVAAGLALETVPSPPLTEPPLAVTPLVAVATTATVALGALRRAPASMFAWVTTLPVMSATGDEEPTVMRP